ncbi:hypothetical protein Syun_014072 [Stephania yunnanensis]|uniref:Uncharacterized protein n=1 Tax=Stephania yunnanensis TaxID=152371 RepID=A0AAP0JIT7_9MAGN
MSVRSECRPNERPQISRSPRGVSRPRSPIRSLTHWVPRATNVLCYIMTTRYAC